MLLLRLCAGPPRRLMGKAYRCHRPARICRGSSPAQPVKEPGSGAPTVRWTADSRPPLPVAQRLTRKAPTPRAWESNGLGRRRERRRYFLDGGGGGFLNSLARSTPALIPPRAALPTITTSERLRFTSTRCSGLGCLMFTSSRLTRGRTRYGGARTEPPGARAAWGRGSALTRRRHNHQLPAAGHVALPHRSISRRRAVHRHPYPSTSPSCPIGQR
jgi:hypothetical protein